MRAARRQQPDAFPDLSLYDTDLHHVEAEARLVQPCPRTEFWLFQTRCVPTWRLIRPGFCIGMLAAGGRSRRACSVSRGVVLTYGIP